MAELAVVSTLYSWPTQLVSAVVITNAVASTKRLRPLVVLAGIFFTVLDLYAYCYPQFTIGAAYPAIAALMLWFVCLIRQRLTAVASAAIVGLTVSSLIRFESALLVCLVALPVVLVHLCRVAKAALNVRQNGRGCGDCSRIAGVLPGVLPLGCAVLLIAGLRFLNQRCYATTPGWEEFSRYNAARGDFVDYNRVIYSEQTRPAFDRAGWSENDFRMFLLWFAADAQIYSLEHVSGIARQFPRMRSDASVSTAADAFAASWRSPELRVLWLATIVVALIAMRSRTQTGLAIVALGWTAGLTIAFV